MSEEMDLLKKIVQADLPAYEYFVPYRYRVVKMHPENNYRVDLQIFKKKSGLPDVLPMIMVPGIAGFVSKLAEGAIVLVSFIEGNPSLPRIIGYSDYEDPGFLPNESFLDSTNLLKLGKTSSSIALGDTDQQRVARYPEVKRFCDDTLLWAASVQSVLTGLGATPPVSPPTTLTIQAASSKVTTQ